MRFSIFATDMIHKPIQIQIHTYIRDPRNTKEHFDHQDDSLVTQSLNRHRSYSPNRTVFQVPIPDTKCIFHMLYINAGKMRNQ